MENEKIQLLEVRRKEITRTSHRGDWIQGYPEEMFEKMLKINNGVYSEDDNSISFTTTDNFEYGYLKEGFLDIRTEQFLVYSSSGDIIIKKYIDGSNIVEITDRVGNFCKIKVENLIIDTEFPQDKFNSIILEKFNLDLLCSGFDKDFIPSDFGRAYIEELNDDFYKIYFQDIFLINSTLYRYNKNGTLIKSDCYQNWLEILESVENSEETNNLNLNLYSEFVYEDFL